MHVFGQSLGPKSGAQPKSFTAGAEPLGFLDGSVNMATGQVEFTMPILSMKSKGNLVYDLALRYSSNNVKNQVGIWNREAPTGIAGLGWSFNFPKIVCDYKGTGSREDDDFYLSDETGTTKLLPYSIPNDEWVFQTKPYQPWKTTYIRADEKWVIIHEDGTKYIFGDIPGGSVANKTMQTVVSWDNWVGNGTDTSVQGSMIYAWNLSSIEDVWGDKISFQYIADEEKVMSSVPTPNHTKASYLSKVTAANNDYITLTYLGKSAGEYVDTHTEKSEPDAYQEEFESKYLSKATYYNANNEVLADARFTYTGIGSSEYYKRQLSGFAVYNAAGNALPGYTFTYETGTGSSNNTGALTRVTSPNKGFVQYTYDVQTLSATSRDFPIPAETNYSEPRLFIGDDYVVLARRYYAGGALVTTGQTVRLDIYTWENGKWITSPGGPYYLYGVKLAGAGTPYRLDVQMTAGGNFFATLHEESTGIYRMNAFGRSEAKPGEWVLYAKTFASATTGSVDHTDVQDPVLCAGEKFILVGSRGPSSASSVQQYIYTYADDAWSESAKTTNQGSYNYVAANNYYIAHKYDANPDQITLYYRKQGGNWGSTAFPSAISPNSTQRSNWTASNGFAVLLGYGDPNKYLYRWTRDYSVISGYANTFSGLTDNAFVDIVNNTMIAVAEQPGAYLFRWTGAAFASSGLLDYYGPAVQYRNLISYGDDYVMRPRTGSILTLTQFNSLTSTFVDKFTASSSSTENYYASIAGSNFVSYSGKFRHRDTNGDWNLDANNISSSDAWFNGTSWNDVYLQAGSNFIATGDPYYPATGANDPTFAVRIKNGAIVLPKETFPYASGKAERIWDRTNQLVSSPQTGANTLVTYLGPLSATFNYMDEASKFHLYRSVQDGFKGALTAMAVKRYDTYDGATTRYNHVVYDPAKATVNTDGTTPFFNKATFFADNDDVASTKPFGYTDNYYFNGMKSADLATDGSFPTVGGNSDVNYKWLIGMPYKVYAYDNMAVLKSKNITDYGKSTFATGFPLIRPLYVRSESDGVTNLLTYNTYNGFNQPTQQTMQNLTGSAFNTTVIDFVYFNTAYDGSNTYNMVSIPVSTKKTIDGNLSEMRATRFKTWTTGKIGLYDNLSWKSGGAETSFTAWSDAATPTAASWKQLTNITAMDNARGLTTETKNTSGLYTTTIWDPTRPIPIAEVKNARTTEVFYNGFEDCTTSNCVTTYAIAGSKSNYNANISISGLTSKTYKLTYWKKISAGGAWKLTETTFTGTATSITGTSVWIDEVRVHPVDAAMTSYSYDKFSNNVTTCDPNNFISYKEYDEFNRLKLVRDKNKNIVESHIYNIK